MKPSILLTALLWLTLLVGAQSKKDSAGTTINLSSLPKSNMSLYPPAKADPAFCFFNHFEVIDERPDKARIGVRTNKTSAMFSGRDRQLVFDGPAATEIANYFNHNFTRPGAPFTALVILRSLWVSDAMYIPRDMTKDQDKKLGWGHVHLKAEIYASRDSLYTPIFRYDTLLRETTSAYHLSANPSYSMLESDLSDLLINLADSASWVARSKQRNSHQITRQQIDDFNQARFSSPFDNKTAYTRGVYMNFEEFRNNAPSVLDFEIKNENKDQQLLYIKDASGTSYYSRTAWGYCDGKSIFIMQGGFLCPAWKEGSAFYFYAVSEQTQLEGGGYDPGTASIRSPTGAVIPGTPGSISPSYEVKKKERSIYALDMDTGATY